MIDNDLRLRRFYQESADPETAVILLDVVLGDGAHPNPAADFAPAIASARSAAHLSGRQLEVVALVVGSESDPQEVAAQIELLREAGAWVETRTERAVDFVGRIITTLNCQSNGDIPAVALDGLTKPLDAINIGLESFYESLTIQGAGAVHVEWRPPAQGNEELMSILANMQS
jgi:FdrA protein